MKATLDTLLSDHDSLERLHKRASSLDGREAKRLDHRIIKNLSDHFMNQQSQGYESGDTFKDLSDESGSLYSTPRRKKLKNELALDRVMPFDFHTHRRAK